MACSTLDRWNFSDFCRFLHLNISSRVHLRRASLVAFAMFRRFEHGDGQFFDVIRNCFDTEGGVVPGLYEVL